MMTNVQPNTTSRNITKHQIDVVIQRTMPPNGQQNQPSAPVPPKDLLQRSDMGQSKRYLEPYQHPARAAFIPSPTRSFTSRSYWFPLIYYSSCLKAVAWGDVTPAHPPPQMPSATPEALSVALPPAKWNRFAGGAMGGCFHWAPWDGILISLVLVSFTWSLRI